MAGVKKSGRSARPVRGAKQPSGRAAAATTARKAGGKKTTGAKRPKTTNVPKTKAPARKAPARKAATRKAGLARERIIVRVRALDPWRMCGPGTSVERLIRVDERVDGGIEAHLVFLDRHGWYCEHGRTCHAVGHARKHRG